MANRAPIDWNKIIQSLIVMMGILVILGTVINLGVLTGGYKCTGSPSCSILTTETTCAMAPECTWQFPTDKLINADKIPTLPTTFFTVLIIGMAAYMGWIIVTVYFGHRWDKKQLISVIVAAVLLYFLYTGLIQPLIPSLPKLGTMAAQLYTLAPHSIQAMMGP